MIQKTYLNNPLLEDVSCDHSIFKKLYLLNLVRGVYKVTGGTCGNRHPIYGPQHQKMYLRPGAPSEDSNQPAHPRSLIRVFVVRLWKLCLIANQKCTQWRFWSDCANAQSDLNLRWAHMSKSRGTLSGVKAHRIIMCTIDFSHTQRKCFFKGFTTLISSCYMHNENLGMQEYIFYNILSLK